MTALRVAHGVVRGLWVLWVSWAALGAALVAVVWPVGWGARRTVLLALLGPLVSLVLHEYGHARAAIRLGARVVRLERVSGAVAVLHESLGGQRDRLVAAAGPGASLVGGAALLCLAWACGSAGLAVDAVVVGAGAVSLLPGTHDGRLIWSAQAAGTAEAVR